MTKAITTPDSKVLAMKIADKGAVFFTKKWNAIGVRLV
jgi:hypothetical protein